MWTCHQQFGRCLGMLNPVATDTLTLLRPPILIDDNDFICHFRTSKGVHLAHWRGPCADTEDSHVF